MQNAIRSLCAVIVCLASSNSLTIAEQMLPGQLERQSLSGGLLYRCLFDALSDAEDGDGWPDYWTRKEGSDNGIPFPRHLAIGIANNINPFGNQVLRMQIEGGGAAVFSPKIPIRPGMSYTLSAFAETDSLVFNEIYILAAFYGTDSQGNDLAQPLYTVESRRIRNTNGWQQLKIGPIPANMPHVKSIAVGLYVMPTNRQDFGSRVHFTNVEIRESPTISLEMANPHHIFHTTRELHVRCQFHGLDPNQHTVLFVLEDHTGRVISQREVGLMIGNQPAARFIVSPQDAQKVLHGTATWQNLPVQSFGFYRIRVATPESYIRTLRLPPDQSFEDPLENTESLTFAIMRQGSYHPGGDFGWTLDGWTLQEIDRALPLLAQSGLSQLKIPVWLPTDITPRDRQFLLRLCNGLSEQQVRLIGLLQPVQKEILARIPADQSVNAASVLGNNPRQWGDALQPTLQTLSLLIKDWQWTSDTDQSLIDQFFDYTGNLTLVGEQRFLGFQRAFDQNQFGFGVGMTWNWYQEVPSEFPIPNLLLNFPIDASVTPEYAASALTDMSALPFRRSVSISPLPADDYSLDTRITNFVQCLVLMKAAGIDHIFLTTPRDEHIGVLRNNGTPSELYLPWRTTATLLSSSRLLGSITLPNRSENYCFDLGGGRCLMVVWNDLAAPGNPIRETLYLGNDLEIIDVWGRQTTPDQQGSEQTIPVTQTPIFVTGLNIDVARFRLSMQTQVSTIPARPSQARTITYTYRNDSAVPVSIRVAPQSPRADDWTIIPATQTANLEPGGSGTGSFGLTLSQRADTGRRLFQYNVQVSGINAPEFAVYDELTIGNPDVYMEFVSRLKADGNLEVIQIFINNSDRVYTYDFRLTIPGRSLEKSRVTRQGFGREEFIYTIPRGRALLASGATEMMLRADPVNDGSGVLGEPMVYTIPLGP
ncbi:MAG: hypothetical protein FWG73_09515 [Planctomycetaceae bacterium]|nr:hypothetical protein [Planctomycetaceae bacterium]